MSPLALLGGASLDAPLAWRDGTPITRRQYLADVAELAARLPERGCALHLSSDRYRFAVGFGAALQRGHASLLPPNHTPDMIERLRARFADVYGLGDAQSAPVALPTLHHASTHAPLRVEATVPLIGADLIAAEVLTSGSTGEPQPYSKPWALLVENARAEAQRLAESMGRADLAGVNLVATVPAQHMYGFESSVLVALLGGAAFETARPFYPADIAEALTRLPRPRVLVTTPFHLKTLLDTNVALPPIDLTLCATAPLTPQLAARAEAALAAPLLEIYGCTEAGQVATRRTTAGPEWHTYGALRLEGDGDRSSVGGGHVPQPTLLADFLEVLDAQRFRLLGRSNDVVNIAGKRSSLGHLNFHLNATPGVLDGAFWMPPEPADDAAVVRLIAFVVAPELSAEAIGAELRRRVDPAFLPRRIVHVTSLPRDPTGKLPASRLAELAERRMTAPSRAAAAGIAIANAADSSPVGAADAKRGPTAVQALSPIALHIAADHPSFAGHFPDRPLLPGVVLLAEVLEAVLARASLAALVGPTPRLTTAKFLAPVGPGTTLALRFDRTPAALRFEVWNGARIAASGAFETVSAAGIGARGAFEAVAAAPASSGP